MRRRLILALAFLLPLLLGGATPARLPVAPTSTGDGCDGLRLNELLPQPQAVDWGGDGTVSELDRWIELYNAGEQPCQPDGWILTGSDGTAYTIPPGTTIPADGYRVYYRSESGVNLSSAGGTVCLRDRDDVLASHCDYLLIAPDRSWMLSAGGTTWQESCYATPGAANVHDCRLYLPLVATGASP